MRRTDRLLASGALVLGATLAGGAGAQQFGTLHTVTGHSFRPERVDATPELHVTLRVPEGFAVAVFAENLGNPRMLAVAEDGTVYVTRPETNDVVALRDEDGDGQADGARRVVATGLDTVHGIALSDGRIYLAMVNEIYEGRITDDGAVSDLRAVIDDSAAGCAAHPRQWHRLPEHDEGAREREPRSTSQRAVQQGDGTTRQRPHLGLGVTVHRAGRL